MNRALPLVFALLGSVLLALLVGPLLAVFFAGAEGASLASFADAELIQAIVVSFFCAGIATLLASLFGIPLAYLLARHEFRGKSLIKGLLSLPLVIPHPVVGIALLLVFARQRLLGSILEGTFGVEIVGAMPGIVLAMMFVEAPLIVRAVEEGVHGFDRRIEWAAQGLGAGPFRTFFEITLPNVRPAILVGMASGLARGVSEFGSIAVIAYFPRTAPVLIWDRFTAYGMSGALPATAVLLTISFALFLTWSFLERRGNQDD